MIDKYTIKLPVIKKAIGHSGILDITKTSPIEYRKALEKIAEFFKKEERFDYVQYRASDNSKPEYYGFCFTESAFDLFKEGDDETPTRILGGGCFRHIDMCGEMRWNLDWVWIHPYKRNQKLFSNKISYFTDKCGEFLLEPPLSKTMEHIFKEKIFPIYSDILK